MRWLIYKKFASPDLENLELESWKKNIIYDCANKTTKNCKSGQQFSDHNLIIKWSMIMGTTKMSMVWTSK